MMGWQWHQLDHMQIICTILQTDNHASTPSLFFTGWMLFLMPNNSVKALKANLTICTNPGILFSNEKIWHFWGLN